MTPYRVFLALEVIAVLRAASPEERNELTRLVAQLAGDPTRIGDYVEHDDYGRPIQVLVSGRQGTQGH